MRIVHLINQSRLVGPEVQVGVYAVPSPPLLFQTRRVELLEIELRLFFPPSYPTHIRYAPTGTNTSLPPDILKLLGLQGQGQAATPDANGYTKYVPLEHYGSEDMTDE